MHAAMDIGVVPALVVVHRVDHACRALRRGAVVQVSQRPAAHHARQDGKFAAHGLDVEGAVVVGECDIFHRNFRSSCESGNWLINAFSIAERAEVTDIPVSTSARKAYTSKLCAVARSRPRDSM